jgi:hypothetical protein
METDWGLFYHSCVYLEQLIEEQFIKEECEWECIDVMMLFWIEIPKERKCNYET